MASMTLFVFNAAMTLRIVGEASVFVHGDPKVLVKIFDLCFQPDDTCLSNAISCSSKMTCVASIFDLTMFR